MPLSSYPYGKEERKNSKKPFSGYPLLNKIFILFNYIFRSIGVPRFKRQLFL